MGTKDDAMHLPGYSHRDTCPEASSRGAAGRVRSRRRGPGGPRNGDAEAQNGEIAAFTERDRGSSERLQITLSLDDDERRIALYGDLNASTVARLDDCMDWVLEDDDPDRIVLDLSGLRVLHPKAMVALVTAHMRASDDHREFMLVRGSSAVQQVIDSVDGPFNYRP